MKLQMTGNGPYIVPQSAINQADGTGVNSGSLVAFSSSEIFFNPNAGTLGTLQRRMFSGPWTFDVDMNLKKSLVIREGMRLEVRMDAFNALNHTTFWAGDQNINSTTFGQVASIFYGPRIVELGAFFRF